MGITQRLPLSREEFDSIYAKVARLTVEVLVHTEDGVLLTRRGIEPCLGYWHLPGGTVLFGERLVDAVRRVARNELDVEVEVGGQLGVIEYPSLLASGYRGWPVGLVFAARIVAGVPARTEQSAQVGYFRTLPHDVIHDQAAFIARLGLAAPAEG
ncbi:NUDIX hydrolase [Saccharothrix variisporea]|uniref:ADP-ribose pyrophosphatase YjhB (NUDIX family) n=1 Tax=Saccharothrix variisporea TaxID=543527 RepID=A0A495XNA5_9PSEU|nr:NUDIX domain-containing protein [Saccharothrix variisporea]RKT74685.1 ADP-ribose pyrophosphatase YjhB (NUDIX family) [Saccharothrix variisporea]